MIIDRKELRRLALEATPGPWQAGYALPGTPQPSYIIVKGDVDFLLVTGGSSTGGGPFFPIRERQAHNLSYIAAANPQVILALLDELEAAEREIV